MKFFYQLLSFIIYSILSLGLLNNVYAEDSSATATKYSAHAFNPKDFCDGREGAEKWMEDLEKINAKKFEKITMYREEIKELVEEDKLVNSIRVLKARYENSLTEIAKTNNSPELIEYIAHIKSILNDGAVLNGVSSRNSSSQQQKKNSPSYVQNTQSVVNFFSKFRNKPAQARIDNLTGQIPEDIAPTQTSALIQGTSPTIYNLLEKNVTKEDLNNCFSNTGSVNACKKFGIAPSERESFMNTLETERVALTQHLSNTPTFTLVTPVQGQMALTTEEAERRKKIQIVTDAQKAIGEATKSIALFTIADKTTENPVGENSEMQVQKTISEKARDEINRNEKQLVGTELLFYHFSIDFEEELAKSNIDLDTEDGATIAIQLQKRYIDSAISDADNFKNNCNFTDKDNTTISKERLNTCIALIDVVAKSVENINESHLYKINDLNSKIKQLTSEDNFGDVEILKQYVAEKYMCSCKKDNKPLISSKESLILKGESCSTEFIKLSKIEGLSDASSFIANALYANEIKIPMDNQSCEKTPDELRATAKTCESNRFINKNFSELCGQIQKEFNVKVQSDEIETKRNASIEKIHNENYVEYNSKSPTGYNVIKKKTKWQVAGEGILPIIPNALPMWLGNFQMKNNINMLTNQALFQKQYLHNVGFFNQSPWSYNYNNLGYGNPFMLGSPTFPGSSIGPTGPTGSNGFNFGM